MRSASVVGAFALLLLQGGQALGQPTEVMFDTHETDLYFREYRQVLTSASAALEDLSNRLVVTRRRMPSKRLIVLRASDTDLWLDTPGGGLRNYEPKIALSNYVDRRDRFSGWFAEGLCLGGDCVVRLRDGPATYRSRVVMGKDPLKWVHLGHSYSINWIELFIPGVYVKSQRVPGENELLEAVVATTERRTMVVEAMFRRRILAKSGLKEVDVWFTSLPLVLEPIGISPWHPFDTGTQVPTEDQLRKGYIVWCHAHVQSGPPVHSSGCRIW